MLLNCLLDVNRIHCLLIKYVVTFYHNRIYLWIFIPEIHLYIFYSYQRHDLVNIWWLHRCYVVIFSKIPVLGYIVLQIYFFLWNRFLYLWAFLFSSFIKLTHLVAAIITYSFLWLIFSFSSYEITFLLRFIIHLLKEVETKNN